METDAVLGDCTTTTKPARTTCSLAHFLIPLQCAPLYEDIKGTLCAFCACLTYTSARGCPLPYYLLVRRPLNSAFKNIKSRRTSTITDVKVCGVPSGFVRLSFMQ
jgi:hypothetical protein